MSYEYLLVKEQEGVAVITLNRPDKRNALSAALRREIVASLEEMDKKDGIVSVVLTGAGPVFCAGFDLSEFQTGNMDEIFAQANVYHHSVYNFKKPIIAAVNGPALAGGMDLAIMCDFRIAVASAQFGQPQVKMGVPAAFDLIKTVLPEGVAREICLTGRRMPADEALRLGLINRIVPDDRLIEDAVEMARETANSGALIKDVIIKLQPELFV